MQLIRCTAKLLKQVGLKPADLNHEDPPFAFLGQWHANLIYIDRRKCVLFVNDRTLFNFILTDVNRAQISALPDLFLSGLSHVISAEEFPEEVNGKILREYEEISLAKSSSKSVLGSANDLAFHYKYSILDAGGVHSWQVPEIIQRMNRMPMQAIRTKFPIEEIRSLYGIAA